MAAFATVSELHTFGAPASAFGSLTDADKLKALEAASGEVEAAASSQGTTPLVAVPADVVQKVCHVAAYELMCRVGFNPAAGSDQNYFLRANAARAYFRDIARGIVRPAFTFAAARETHAQPQVRSKRPRGW